MTEEAACARVAGIEYPRECGSCDPASCDDNVPPNPPRASYCGACGDNGYCTLDVWKSVTDRDNFLSCEALITWVQTHDDARAAEIDACRLVAEQHPLTSCGKLCNPATCDSASDGDPLDDRFCGCEDCTDAILDRDASRPGEPATCRDRIQFLMRNPPDGGVSYTEEYACAAVAGEFPEICGPQVRVLRCVALRCVDCLVCVESKRTLVLPSHSRTLASTRTVLSTIVIHSNLPALFICSYTSVTRVFVTGKSRTPKTK